MNPKTRVSVLGWVAAALLNVGTLLFIVGLIVPHGDGPGATLLVAIALLVTGLAAAAAWLYASRSPRD
ncbi:hypothetical protein G3T36_04670 [Diaminobutyricibacter tongyongensis]|uniref:Uncharacterized protein n=1 Tax=Leifsonia tongyongensis TaxID=1268043 RepID=A0A6L9XVX2_9MICO|nr:hypothetical protein [Diaminobutyricibacter tongyongensis]NEN05158.1 hypothetical protein [Diaminobutyricibacter tongyongensis]